MPAGLDGNPDPIVTAARSAVIEHVAAAVLDRKSVERPLLVAVDGIDGSGKSTFADELAARLSAGDVRVVRSTIDSFHNPRATRMERGPTSPVGFYLDSHNLDAVQRVLLEPFAAGHGDFTVGIFDEPSDAALHLAPVVVQPHDVLIFDGIFAQRPELASYWDLTIYLEAQERVDLRRLGFILTDLPEDPLEVVAHVLDWDRKIDRYSSGMGYYLGLVNPAAAADIVIDNNDLALPVIVGHS